MSRERETHGTPGKLADALLEQVSAALVSLEMAMLQEGFTISPNVVNALNNLQQVLLALSQGALPECRGGFARRLLERGQPLLLLAGLMVSLQELQTKPLSASSSNPLEPLPSVNSEASPTLCGCAQTTSNKHSPIVG